MSDPVRMPVSWSTTARSRVRVGSIPFTSIRPRPWRMRATAFAAQSSGPSPSTICSGGRGKSNSWARAVNALRSPTRMGWRMPSRLASSTACSVCLSLAAATTAGTGEIFPSRRLSS